MILLSTPLFSHWKIPLTLKMCLSHTELGGGGGAYIVLFRKIKQLRSYRACPIQCFEENSGRQRSVSWDETFLLLLFLF
jgi:hypothetical protein